MLGGSHKGAQSHFGFRFDYQIENYRVSHLMKIRLKTDS
jgi:hypothetical protein